MANTTATKKLEARRNSLEVQEFKQQVIEFLNVTKASDEIKYKICCDLAKKIDMPFYHEAKLGVKSNLKSDYLAKEYIKLLISYGDNVFAERLLSWLSRQQKQTFRNIYKLSPKQKARRIQYNNNGVYEHPVPVNFSKQMFLCFIKNKDYKTACEYVDFLSNNVPQIFLTRQQDDLVNKVSRDTMPEGWDWKKDSPFIRYKLANLPADVYN